jgi:hypothetical protein
MFFLEIKKAQYLEEYKILLEFNNGVKKTVDLKDKLNGEVFEPLRELNFFRAFTIKYNTIEWNNGADFAPEYLFEIGV